MQVQAEKDVLQRRHLLEESGQLERAHQSPPDDLMRPEPGDVVAVEPDGAGRRPDEAGQQIEAGRLARAVRANQADDLAFGDGQIDMVDGGESAEIPGEALRFEKGPGAHAAELGLSAAAPFHHRSAASFPGSVMRPPGKKRMVSSITIE